MNRTIILIIGVSMFATAIADAQLARTFGIKAGVAAATQDWEHPPISGISFNLATRLGVDLGGYVEWFSHPVLSVSTEIHYIQKGFKPTGSQYLQNTGDPSFYADTPRLDYLSFPLLAKCRLEFGSVSFYVLFGAQFDILLASIGPRNFYEMVYWPRSTELGATMGLGFESTRIGPLTLGTEFRFSPSLQDAYSDGFLSVRNHSLEVLLVVGFEHVAP